MTGVRLLLCLVAFWAIVAKAEEENTRQSGYAERSDALMRIHRLATDEGFDETYLHALLLATEKDESVLRKISRPAEKTKTWAEYRPIFLDQARIDNGVAFWAEHADTLARAEKEFGVDAAVIVAILGVETRYGKVTGTTPVFAALTTLCFDYPPRADFFCEQWDGFLRLAQQQNFNPLAVKGSYAGAMGMAQFMPTSYLNDAVDYDGDGHINLWLSSDDAIGSIARYLGNRGWVRGGKIAEQLTEKPNLAHFGQSHEPYFERTSIQNEQNVINQETVETPVMVGSLVLDGTAGEEWWITYPNFYAITRYNTSPLYAMAVTQLSRQIQSSRKRHIHDEKWYFLFRAWRPDIIE